MMQMAALAPRKGMRTVTAAATDAVNKALSYIDDHYSEDIRIGDLANEGCLSETHFRRLFNEAVSMAPNDYVNLVRIQKACDLLRFSDDSMTDIAMKTGFDSQVSFNRNFVKM